VPTAKEIEEHVASDPRVLHPLLLSLRVREPRRGDCVRFARLFLRRLLSSSARSARERLTRSRGSVIKVAQDGMFLSWEAVSEVAFRQVVPC
jgi:hypothetical protein